MFAGQSTQVPMLVVEIGGMILADDGKKQFWKIIRKFTLLLFHYRSIY